MTPYEDLSSMARMQADCRATSRNLHLERAAEQVFKQAPSIHFDEFPREVPKREIRISEAAQRIANALELHLD